MKFTERNCECAACGLWFSALSVFDRHRYTVKGTDKRACRDEAWLAEKGFVLRDGQWGREGMAKDRLSRLRHPDSLPSVERVGTNTAPGSGSALKARGGENMGVLA